MSARGRSRLSTAEMRELRETGWSFGRIAELAGVGKTVVWRRLQARGRSTPTSTDDPAVLAYLDHLRVRNLRPATIYGRHRALTRLRCRLDVELLDVSTGQLAQWYASLKMTPQARAAELAAVRGFYKWALTEELVAADPTRRLVRPRVPRRLPRPMPAAAVRRALDEAPDRIRPWLHLAAFAGLRAGEIARLRREDVLDGASPPVLVVVDGKGGRQRVVPLVAVVLDALQVHGLPPAGPVFPRHDDEPGTVQPHNVSHLTNRYLHGLGIGHTLHTLRHFFATALYHETRDLRAVQELLGHASPVTTAGYAAWSPGLDTHAAIERSTTLERSTD